MVDYKGKIYRTQIKKGRYHNGALQISLCAAKYNKDRRYSPKHYTDKDIDWLIGVDVEHEKFYLIDYTSGEFNGRSSIWLRVEEDGARKNAVFAKDYQL